MSSTAGHATADLVATRLAALRRKMGELRLDVYLVPSADEHQNEYVPAYTRRREALSGFDGSAGDLAVLAGSAHLWVDSRYHLQAETQLDPQRFSVHKLGLEGVKELPAWLAQVAQEQPGLRIGYDPFVLSLRALKRLQDALSDGSGSLTAVPDNLVDAVWTERPPAPGTEVYALPDETTGESVADKLARLREAMQEAGTGALVLSKLDEVAWVTNLRGADIAYNPVFVAYLVLTPEEACCYTDNPVAEAAVKALDGQVRFAPYADFRTDLPRLAGRLATLGQSLWLDADGSSEGTRLLTGGADLVQTTNPVVGMKAAKNAVEIAHAMEAQLRSGAAKVRSFSQLHALLAEGQPVSEASYATLLEAEYAKEADYADLSFNTIAGFGANGAIVHYGTPDPDAMLSPEGILLVDSGIQAAGATTDDTRTLSLGQPSAEQRQFYTAVLRGHIALARQVFPEGTNGQMLDTLARSALWNLGADFGHGTGHGVGAFLNVHEGPASISPRGMVPLAPGMILSNEPGYYRHGWGGIRLENLYVVEEALGLPPHPGGKRWLRFRALTMIPFDPALIDWAALTHEEQAWLRDYHRTVWEALSPRLEEPHRHWLQQACTLPG